MVDGLLWYMDFVQSYYEEEEDRMDLPSGDSYEKVLFLPRFYHGIADFLTIRLTFPVIIQSKIFGESKERATGIGDLVIDPKICLV